MGVAELTELRVYGGAGVNDDLKQFQADLLGVTNWRRSGVPSGASSRSWVATKPRHA
jgi:glycerol kinase